MKRIFPFVLLAVVLVSCSKDKEDPIPEELITDIFYGYQVTDTVGIDRETVSIFSVTDGITGISGIKSNKIWVGLYDAVSKKEIQTWIGNAPREEGIAGIYPSKVLPFDWGYAVLVGVNTTSTTWPYYGAVLILKEATKEIITYNFPEPDYNTTISPFSDNIMVTSLNFSADYESIIISPDGECIYNSVFSHSIGDSNLYYGFNPSDHLWFALCDKSNKILKEWNGTEKMEQNISIRPSKLLPFDWGYAMSIGSKLLILKETVKEIITYDLSGTSPYEISPFSDNIMVTFQSFGEDDDKHPIIISPDGECLFNSVSSISIGDSILYYGFNQSDHYWFALYDGNNKILKEWNGTEKVERNIKFYVGYGEYVDYDIIPFRTVTILETAWGYVIQPSYGYGDFGIREYFHELLLLNGDRVYRVAEDKEVEMRDWYEGTFITTTTTYSGLERYTVYSPTGDIILTKNNELDAYGRAFQYGYITPVSYESYLCWDTYSLTLHRYNIGSLNPLWESVIKDNLPDDMAKKVEWTILENESNNWKFQVDVIDYYGSKEKIVFTVNIDTGDVTMN